MVLSSIQGAVSKLLIALSLSLCTQPVLANEITTVVTPTATVSAPTLQDPEAKLEADAQKLTEEQVLAALRGAVSSYAKVLEDQESAEPEQKDALKTQRAILAQNVRIYADILRSKFKVSDGEVERANQLLLLNEGKLSDLDAAAALGLAEKWTEAGYDWLIEEGPGILFAILKFFFIIFAFRILAGLLSRVVRKATQSSKLQISSLLREFAVSITRKLTILIGLLVAVNSVGIDIAPLIAGITALGLVVGLALQGTLSNFASGIMLLLYRPFDVGDAVKAGGETGKVESMNLVSTTILTFDNQKVIVPNNSIWGNVITNITANTTRRVDLVFGIGYSDDIPKAETVLREIVEGHAMVLKDPEPVIKLYNLNDSSVDFVCRPWCKTEDYWDVHWDITRTVKLRFDEEGISIPFPQQDVHMFAQAEEAPASNAGKSTAPSKSTPETGTGEVDVD